MHRREEKRKQDDEEEKKRRTNNREKERVQEAGHLRFSPVSHSQLSLSAIHMCLLN
jgi:hypothetical protein